MASIESEEMQEQVPESEEPGTPKRKAEGGALAARKMFKTQTGARLKKGLVISTARYNEVMDAFHVNLTDVLDVAASVQSIRNAPAMQGILHQTVEQLNLSEIWYTASGRKVPRRGKNVINWWKASREERKKLTETTVAGWKTLTEEKSAIVVIPPAEAERIRQEFADRIMESKLVHTATMQPDNTCKYKSRWCVMGNGDPDRLLVAAAGATASPTAASSSRTMMFQWTVSNKCVLRIGDVKGAFLETGELTKISIPQ